MDRDQPIGATEVQLCQQCSLTRQAGCVVHGGVCNISQFRGYAIVDRMSRRSREVRDEAELPRLVWLGNHPYALRLARPRWSISHLTLRLGNSIPVGGDGLVILGEAPQWAGLYPTRKPCFIPLRRKSANFLSGCVSRYEFHALSGRKPSMVYWCGGGGAPRLSIASRSSVYLYWPCLWSNEQIRENVR